MFKPGKAIVPTNGTGSAPDSAVTPQGLELSFDRGVNRIRQATLGVVITNREAGGGNILEVSFDNGSLWTSLQPGPFTMYMPVVTHRMRVRGAAGAVALYSVMGIV